MPVKQMARAQVVPEDRTLCETLLQSVKEKCHDAR
jgi:hypothetical protein